MDVLELTTQLGSGFGGYWINSSGVASGMLFAGIGVSGEQLPCPHSRPTHFRGLRGPYASLLAGQSVTIALANRAVVFRDRIPQLDPRHVADFFHPLDGFHNEIRRLAAQFLRQPVQLQARRLWQLQVVVGDQMSAPIGGKSCNCIGL